MAGTSGGNTSNWYGCKYGDTANKIIEEFSVFPTAQEVGISWPGHQLLSWNSAADGTGTTYQIGDSGVQADANYYAQWDYIDQEDLIISNHSLIDIGDAIRKSTSQNLSLSLEDIKTTIEGMAPTDWDKLKIDYIINTEYTGYSIISNPGLTITIPSFPCFICFPAAVMNTRSANQLYTGILFIDENKNVKLINDNLLSYSNSYNPFYQFNQTSTSPLRYSWNENDITFITQNSSFECYVRGLGILMYFQ